MDWKVVEKNLSETQDLWWLNEKDVDCEFRMLIRNYMIHICTTIYVG